MKVGTGETRFSLDEKDFTPFQWKALMRQAKVEKLLGKKSSKLALMAATFRAENENDRRVRQYGPASGAENVKGKMSGRKVAALLFAAAATPPRKR